MKSYDNLQAIELFNLILPDNSVLIDVGSGSGAAAKYLEEAGHAVHICDYGQTGERFEDLRCPMTFDGLYCSHMLEHVRNPGIVLDKMRQSVRDGGYICILVPPAKHNIVGGHLTLWNAGLLIYNLIRAHIDCKRARIRTYGYNIAVIVPNDYAEYDENKLAEDNGDIEALAEFFPVDVVQGFDGRVDSHNWRP